MLVWLVPLVLMVLLVRSSHLVRLRWSCSPDREDQLTNMQHNGFNLMGLSHLAGLTMTPGCAGGLSKVMPEIRLFDIAH